MSAFEFLPSDIEALAQLLTPQTAFREVLPQLSRPSLQLTPLDAWLTAAASPLQPGHEGCSQHERDQQAHTSKCRAQGAAARRQGSSAARWVQQLLCAGCLIVNL